MVLAMQDDWYFGTGQGIHGDDARQAGCREAFYETPGLSYCR
jgi:hypothetical protein